MIKTDYITTIGELRNNGRSNTIITLSDGDKVFADENYEQVKLLYEKSFVQENEKRPTAIGRLKNYYSKTL